MGDKRLNDPYRASLSGWNAYQQQKAATAGDKPPLSDEAKAFAAWLLNFQCDLKLVKKYVIAEIDRLQAIVDADREQRERESKELPGPSGWICKQCFTWTQTRVGGQPCPVCGAPWELQHPVAERIYPKP